MRSLPAPGEACRECGGRLAVDRRGVVRCAGECGPEPCYGEAVGFTDYGAGPVLACCRCGYKGVPTFWAGRLVLECPRCEGADEDVPPPPPGKHWVIRRRRAREASGVSRNAPCPCGSGVKFKKCCGR